MAAPDSTKWGNVITGSKSTRKGKIGIYVNVSSTSTETTVTVQVYFWSMYSLSDTNNSFYYNKHATSASTLIGSKTISHSVASGSGWSTSNQTKLYEDTYTYTRGTSASTKYYAAKITGLDNLGSSNVSSVYGSATIPALASYKVTYNANGGSGAPSSQTKYYGKSLTLSTTKPTRTGYTFKGWGTSATDTTVDYAAGASYTANAAITLYAIWTAKTYTVKYNANGGSGAPSNQTKTYGVSLTLSSTKPTRSGYTFKGWGTSTSATTVAYKAGGTYTANAGITLYAIWTSSYKKPTIKSFSVTRCTSAGTASENGKYALVKFNWTTSIAVSSIKITWSSSSKTVTASGTSGTVSEIVGGSFSTDSTYSIKVTVADSSGSSSSTKTLTGTAIEIDVLKGGGGVSIGKAAEKTGYLDVGYEGMFRKNIMTGSKTGYNDGLQGSYISAEGFIQLQRETSQGKHPYIAFYLDDAASANGVIRLNSTTGLLEYVNVDGNKFTGPINTSGNICVGNKTGYQDGNTGVFINKAGYMHLQRDSSDGNPYIGFYSGTVTDYNAVLTYVASEKVFKLVNNDGEITLAPKHGGYKPYYCAGDTITCSIQTAGYMTNGGTEVHFMVSLAKPILNSPTVTAASVDGIVLRQDGQYTCGSSATAYAKPSSYVAYGYYGCGVRIVATLSNTTNVVNNAPVGVHWSGTITLS